MKLVTPEGYTFVTKFQEINSHKVLRSVEFFSIKFDEIFFDTVCWVDNGFIKQAFILLYYLLLYMFMLNKTSGAEYSHLRHHLYR